MKSFFVTSKSCEEEAVKATSMHVTAKAVYFKRGRAIVAVFPLSEIIRASVSRAEPLHAEDRRVGLELVAGYLAKKGIALPAIESESTRHEAKN